MARERLQPEEIILQLREVEIQQGKGLDLTASCRNVGITDATYYRWRKQYGGMQINQAKKYKEEEKSISFCAGDAPFCPDAQDVSVFYES